MTQIFFGPKDADQNFDRNIHYRSVKSNDAHPVIQCLHKFPVTASRILEIGAGNGCVLARIHEMLPKAELYGIDPSGKAVAYGNQHFSPVKLVEGTCDDLLNHFNGIRFDLIIFGGVLFHVNPSSILRVLADADSLLLPNGLLLFFDFYPQSPSRTAYKHNTELSVYKYDHQSIIEALPFYKKLFYSAIWSDELYARREIIDLSTAHYVAIHKKVGLDSFNFVEDPTLTK